jgi:hypothetical protein
MSRMRREQEKMVINLHGAIAPPMRHLLKERLIHAIPTCRRSIQDAIHGATLILVSILTPTTRSRWAVSAMSDAPSAPLPLRDPYTYWTFPFNSTVTGHGSLCRCRNLVGVMRAPRRPLSNIPSVTRSPKVSGRCKKEENFIPNFENFGGCRNVEMVK